MTSLLDSGIDLNFPSTTPIQKMRNTWDFSVVLELSSTYMELGTWMLEEYYSVNFSNRTHAFICA